MIISRTPFRIPLGGGSTDLPSYYEKFGGFIFGVAIQSYVHIFAKRLALDDRIQFHYTDCEVVDSVNSLHHEIGREALRIAGIDRAVSVTFNADSPAGTGLGSSGSYALGLLNTLFALKGERKTPEFLAEKSFEITERIRGHEGKQDPYLAAFGGFTVLEIGRDGGVAVRKPAIARETTERFLSNTLFFYTGIKRPGASKDILKEQDAAAVLELKHRTKEIGRSVLRAFEEGDLDQFGRLLDAHWRIKQKMSSKISTADFDAACETAKECGALGGKLIGAGGGGYLMFYCPDPTDRARMAFALAARGLRRVHFAIDYQGSVAIDPDFSPKTGM